MNNENKENNVVDPQKVDLNAVQINQNDTMLNRERTNIVSATIQANDNLDEKKALKVNDTIKVKKMNPFFKTLIILISLCLAAAAAYGIYYFAYKFVNYEDPSTTTTTTTAKTELDKMSDYVKNMEKVRKFQSDQTYNINGMTYDKYILLLSPAGYMDSNTYMLIMSDGTNNNVTSGTYTLIDDNVNLDNGTVLNIREKGLFNSELQLDINSFDSELKYYANKDTKSLLLINGTIKSESALFITNNTANVYSYQETKENITLGDNMIFAKAGLNVNYYGNVLYYVE